MVRARGALLQCSFKLQEQTLSANEFPRNPLSALLVYLLARRLARRNRAEDM